MNVIFKIFTSILKIKIEKRMKKNGTPLSTFQFGAMKKNIDIKASFVGFKQPQRIVFSKRKEQSILKCIMAWLKAYDSVIHSTLIEKFMKKGIGKRVIKVIQRILEITSIELFCG